MGTGLDAGQTIVPKFTLRQTVNKLDDLLELTFVQISAQGF